MRQACPPGLARAMQDEIWREVREQIFCHLGLLHAVARNFARVPRFVRLKFQFLER